MLDNIALLEYSQPLPQTNEDLVWLFGDDADYIYQFGQDDLLPVDLKSITSYGHSEWLDAYIKSISPAPAPEPTPSQKIHEHDLKWFLEQISHIPEGLHAQVKQKYFAAAASGSTDGERRRLSNVWLRETVDQIKEHPLNGTTHAYELTRQVIQNEYRAPPSALDGFTPWILKNSNVDDSEIKNIARTMSQQFQNQKFSIKKEEAEDRALSIIDQQKLAHKLGQFGLFQNDKHFEIDELIKQISRALNHATTSMNFNIQKFKKWAPNHFIKNSATIDNFLMFTKKTRVEREKNSELHSELNPYCPTPWVIKHCHDQSFKHIENLAYGIIRELDVDPNIINEWFIKNRLGEFADPFFREKNPIAANELNLRRQLRKAFRQANETAALCLRKVGARGENYVSDLTLFHRKHQLAAQSVWIAQTYCKSDSKTIPLLQCIRSPYERFCEMYALVNGLDKYYTSKGYTAVMVTFTMPARFHPNPSIGTNRWDGSSPRAAHSAFTENWALLRTALHDAGIDIHGLKVAEVHVDGCPHYHVLFFVAPGKYDRFVKIVNEYFAHSPSAVDFELIDRSKGSAAGYILKYIMKNVSGTSAGDALEQDSIDRADAFRSTWNIRAFQFFGVLHGRVTLWRELRRLETQPDDAEHLAKSLWRAARGTKADLFIALLDHKDKSDEIKTIREPIQTNEWTEPDADGAIEPVVKPGRILGVQINQVDYITHAISWTLISLLESKSLLITDDSEQNSEDSTVSGRGPRNPKTDPASIPESPGFRH
ncbi:MAG: replication endonuclease [Sulfuriferula sp.]